MAYRFALMTPPDYAGGSIVNLVASIEQRLTGSTTGVPLRDELVPESSSYLLVLLDGLGDGQLAHSDAAALATSRAGAVDTVFPTTTTTALASIATANAPAQHGLLGYELWLPEADGPVNTIHWKPVGGGDVVDIDFNGFLPSPNLWERLAAAEREPVTVQPANFAGTPLSRVLYRGCRYEPVDTYEAWLEAAIALVAEPGRLVFAYFGAIDVAAHLRGQQSEEYAGAIRLASALWERLALRLPQGASLIGTADHGHVDVVSTVKLTAELQKLGEVYGDGRTIFARSDVSQLGDGLPATWVEGAELASWFGQGPPNRSYAARAPAGVLAADDGVRLLHDNSDPRLVGTHGALSSAELRVPVLIAP
jgi:hypothetical protein